MRPVVDALLGLNKSPIDAEVGDCGHGKIFRLERAVEGLILDGKSLGPLGAGVEAVAVEALKRGESDIGIDEGAIEWFRLHGDGLGH